MKCRDVQNQVFMFHEKTVPEAVKAAIAAHLDTCPSCRRYYQRAEALERFIAREKQSEAGPFFYTRLEQNMINRKREHYPVLFRRRVWEPVLVAASIVVMIWLGILAGTRSGGIAISPSATIESQVSTDDFYLNETKNEIETTLLAEE